MKETEVRQLQKKIFETFTKLQQKREIILSKSDKMPASMDKLILLAKATGLADGIIEVGSLIEFIEKQVDEESKNSVERNNFAEAIQKKFAELGHKFSKPMVYDLIKVINEVLEDEFS